MKRKITLIIFLLSNIISIAQTKNLSVDFSNTNGSIKKLTSVNNGPVSVVEGTSEECYRKIGVEMVRTHDFHGPFDYFGYTDFYNVFTETFDFSFQSHNPLAYNWSDTDNKIQEIINPGFKPFFRLGISFPGQGNPALTPIPKDQDGINFHTFAGICKRTAMHYTDSWSNGFTYDIPYWEVWNEPNNGASWTVDSVQAYYRMYKQVADSMKNFNPNIKVGGPGTAKSAFYTGGNYFNINPNYVSNFFQYCQTNNAPLDFYSFHTYDRKNPYHIKQLADTISYFLNLSGFNQTELIVSEMNVNTGGFINTGKGCAHLASTLISASDSRITKLLWYRGVDLGPLCNSDLNGEADLLLNGYAYQFFNELYDSTNIRLATTGSEFVLNNINDSLNNLMLISGKSADNNLVKILVSNYESIYSDINISLSNLPWNNQDQIDISIQKVTDNGLETTHSTVNGSNSLVVNLANVNDASTYLITLKNNMTSNISEISSNELFSIYPNPTNSLITIKCEKELKKGELIITNQIGETISSYSELSGNEFNIQVETLNPGIYFVTLKNENCNPCIQKLIVNN
jgi:hypothetical protein